MNKQNFQIIIYVAFGFFILVGFGSLALYGLLQKNEQTASSGSGSAQDGERVEIVVWGTLDADIASPVFRRVRGSANKGYETVRYIKKNADTIESEYVRAIAYDERAPDLLLLESAEVLAFEQMALRTIPFGYPPINTAAEYQNLFTPATNIFLRSGGYIALPIVADSLVLYYNEGLRRQSNLRQLPKVWEDFTEKEYQDIAKEYRKSEKAIVPFGAYGNYTNAPYLFATLMLQAREFGTVAPPAEDLITFYTSFVALRSSVQTWSETFLNARSMFVGNNLLFYPGFISEHKDLQRANPNIVIQVAPLPQLAAGSAEAVPTKLYALTIPEKSKHLGAAHQVVFDVATVIQRFPTEIFQATSVPAPINNFDRTSRVALARTDEEARKIETFFNAITANEQVFIDTLFSGRSIPLSQEVRTSTLNALKNVIIGIRTAKQEARGIEALFEE